MPQMHVIGSEGQLVPMSRSAFENEDLLQQLLAKYPDLMPGELVDEVDPRRWLLITREAGIALGGEGGNRWSLDHLFVDQDGKPTLVEVKRSTDTRARREVVAQMLDYAANLTAWAPGKVVETFEHRCNDEGTSPDAELETFLGPDIEPQAFWENVDAKLNSGMIRLVFLADEISPELTQIIQFLNSQFSRAEVLGIEVRQWKGEGLTTLVSGVVGRPSRPRTAASGPATRMTEAEFLERVQVRAPQSSASLQKLMQWCRDHNGFVSFGTGREYPACYLNWRTPAGKDIWPLIPVVPSTVTVAFDGLSSRAPFDDPALRTELKNRLEAVKGVNLSSSSIDRRPTFQLAVLDDAESFAGITSVLEWFIETLKTAPTS